MTLSYLYSLGAYIVAGHLDIYHDGKVVRLGSVSATGEVDLTPSGQALIEALAPSKPEPDPVPARAPRKTAPKVAKPAAPVVELGTTLNILDAVDE